MTNYFRPQKLGRKIELGVKFNTKEECEEWIVKNIYKIERNQDDYKRWYAQSCTVYSEEEYNDTPNTWRFQ